MSTSKKTNAVPAQRVSVPKKVRAALDAAEAERHNDTSRVAFAICRHVLEQALSTTDLKAKRSDLKLASEWYFNILRAEKSDDTAKLEELEEMLKSANEDVNALEDL